MSQFRLLNSLCIFEVVMSYWSLTHPSQKFAGTVEVFAPPRGCMTLTMVVGLEWSNESWSNAGGSVATGIASHARLVHDEDPD
jgi:hypothetical protein